VRFPAPRQAGRQHGPTHQPAHPQTSASPLKPPNCPAQVQLRQPDDLQRPKERYGTKHYLRRGLERSCSSQDVERATRSRAAGEQPLPQPPVSLQGLPPGPAQLRARGSPSRPPPRHLRGIQPRRPVGARPLDPRVRPQRPSGVHHSVRTGTLDGKTSPSGFWERSVSRSPAPQTPSQSSPASPALPDLPRFDHRVRAAASCHDP